MKPEQLELLLKARQSILAAQLLLHNSFAEYSVSRSYSKFSLSEVHLMRARRVLSSSTSSL